MRSRLLKTLLTRRTFLISVFAVLFDSNSIASAVNKSPSIKILSTSASSATFQISTAQKARCWIEYGTKVSKLNLKSQTISVTTQSKISIGNLIDSQKYFYRLCYVLVGSNTVKSTSAQYFSTFTANPKSVFAIQADPHMDENSDEKVYLGTLNQIKAASPAFLLDLGDIFMVDKLQDKSESNIRARFELMKNYYKVIGEIPLKICLGNHDGELGYSKFNTKNYRKEYFPEQTSDVSYFSLTGPDQLHVVLDPFTYTTENPKDDGWQWTLGKEQYDWLKKTLVESKATHKFIYIHHLLVGNAQSRGGVEIAHLNEWGGQNVDGTYGFDEKRPGWGKPIHQILIDNRVSYVFKGHDHLYVKQEKDGIIYQTIAQPSHPGKKVDPTQYGYLSGKTVGGSGFLKVSTSGRQSKVEFILFDGTLGDSYVKEV